MRYYKYLLFVTSLLSTQSQAQSDGPAVGKWNSLYCYYGASSAAIGNDEIYVGTSTGFYTLDLEDKITTKYSKVNGMNDADVVYTAFDKKSANVLIAYKSSNMDIYKNGKFRNVPDLMTSTLPGDKTINHVNAFEDKAYVSTPLGIVVINLLEGYVDYTTPFFEDGSRLNVYSTAIKDGIIYAATARGLFSIDLHNAFIQDFTKWEKHNSQPLNTLTANSSGFYAVKKRLSGTVGYDSVYKVSGTGVLDYFYRTDREVSSIEVNKDGGIWIGERYKSSAGNVSLYQSTGIQEKSYEAFFPTAIVESASGELYFSDFDFTEQFGGLRTPASAGNNTIGYAPSGPESPYSFDVWAYNSEVWIAHGGHGVNWNFYGNRKAFSAYRKGVWKNFANSVADFGVLFLSDASTIYKDRSTETVYVGMVMGGMITVDKHDKLSLFQEDAFESVDGSGTDIRVTDIAPDAKGNIWFSNMGADKPIKVKTRDDKWFSYYPSALSNKNTTKILIDDHGYKWTAQAASGGVLIFDDGGTLDNTGDDRSRTLRSGVGNGNLASNINMCLAKDKDGAIWIGSNDGIAYVENPQGVLLNGEDAKRPVNIFEEGTTGGHLFQGKMVTSIAVDGNNNKWIGTNDAGVWLLNENASAVLQYFHKGNSPLPDNQIMSIDIDPVTGDVYFSTSLGVMVYRGEATDAPADYAEDMYIYPNPVSSGFEGMIAIKGLKGNTEIRITDVAGALVTQFSTQGGQAVWNGRDYTGRRPQTGVYLVFATDKSTGKTMKTGKIIFHE